MGKISQGILGGFSGKVGNVIGGNWKGIDYMRIKPANVANPQTEGQVDQRTKFYTVLQFLQPLKDFVKIGYKNYAIKMTEFNSAMSYILTLKIFYSSIGRNVKTLSLLFNRSAVPPDYECLHLPYVDKECFGQASLIACSYFSWRDLIF
ncbi:MAG: hypothetical protein J7K46_07590 [Bacteroidales bacterium]|nr:hypothetical protein [Bacteroidales bacterium]